MFVGDGRAVAEGGMQPRRVVPAFDEAEAGDLRRGLRRKAAAFEQLAFEGREEALAHRVVVGVADRSHRWPHAGFLAAFAECQRRVVGGINWSSQQNPSTAAMRSGSVARGGMPV